jgi:hypothetical protein
MFTDGALPNAPVTFTDAFAFALEAELELALALGFDAAGDDQAGQHGNNNDR